MHTRAPWIALVSPVALTWAAALAFSLSSISFLVFALTVGLPLVVVITVVSVGLGFAYFVRRVLQHDARPQVRLIGFLAIGLALSVLTCLPAIYAAQWVTRQVRQPVRAVLAPRMIQRAQTRGGMGHSEVELTGLDALLSDGGRADVYVDGQGVSILFWDVQGIMSGSASAYVSDASAASPPGGVTEEYEVEHEAGHWWTVVEDN
jgi:hypothetical protein